MLWEEAVLIHFTVRKPRSNPVEHCHEGCNEWEAIEVRLYSCPFAYGRRRGVINARYYYSGMVNIFGKCEPIMAGIMSCRIINNYRSRLPGEGWGRLVHIERQLNKYNSK